MRSKENRRFPKVGEGEWDKDKREGSPLGAGSGGSYRKLQEDEETLMMKWKWRRGGKERRNESDCNN